MTNFQRKFNRLINPTALGFIITGYILLVGIIFFREEINMALDHLNTPAMASVEAVKPPTAFSGVPPKTVIAESSLPTYTQPIVEPQPLRAGGPQGPEATYDEYVQKILNDPDNFVRPERILPGRAYLEGKTTKFLVGF
jgi:hypothetical protein